MKKHLLLPAIVLLFSLTAQSQSLPDSITKKIDLLFRKWDSPTSAGAAFGIVRGDSLIYAKGFGMADLEHHIPITPESIFYMCSVSKQFTGYSIILLERAGKLNLDDDITKYLPWANFGSKITIRNLLNHTSGIRDDLDLATIAGLPVDGIITEDYALNLLKKQHSLNFKPGEKYTYSNSNFVLLAEIVRVVSRQSFASFTDSAIFQPLGMKHSKFVDQSGEIVDNRVLSYDRTDTSLRNDMQNAYTVGDGGLFTNIDDMVHWVANFYDIKVGDSKTIERLTQNGTLNNGKKITYACGINSDSSRGYKRYWHNGGLAGYATRVVIYPELKMGFIVFGNCNDWAIINKPDQLAALFIPDKSQKMKPFVPVHRDSAMAILKNPGLAAGFGGNYIAENGYHLQITYKDKRLWANGQILLVNDKWNTFSAFDNPGMRITFKRAGNSITGDLYNAAIDETMHMEGHPIDPKFTDTQLASYTGGYYCPELECFYKISLKDHQLYFSSSFYPETAVTLLGSDDLFCDNFPLAHVRVTRDKNRQVTGFIYSQDAIAGLKFEKVRK
jgi:CubicO group peptidase (beta-lactamase class C family)